MNHLSFRRSANFFMGHVIARHLHKQQSPLYLLRQKTGLAYTLCREALDKHDNDVERASTWLEAQAITLGLQKATKLQNRTAKQGLIGMSVSYDNRLVTVLELNCETDFVAKNQVFKDFAINMIQHLSPVSVDSSTEGHVDVLALPKTDLDNIDAQIPPLISKLGENIKVTFAKHYHMKGPNNYIFGQIHAQACSKETNSASIYAGRFGGIVGLVSNISHDLNQLRLIGNRLCQHVIGFNPSYIELPADIKDHLDKEAAKRKESEAAANKIQEENDDGYSSEPEETNNNRDDWPSIMDQTLIMSQDQSVREFCNQQSISIVYFNRMECGQIQ